MVGSTRRGSLRRNQITEREKPRGFDRGLEIDKIVGAAANKDGTFYLVKWKECDEFDLLPSKDLSERMPEFLIQYHEQRTNIWERVEKRNIPNIPIKISRAPITSIFPKKEVEVDDAVANEPV